ncbi:unnamed protein product [Lactuca virosa]|uniref:STI1 domain-containing protein n=1 Tax=Lactuca virosa TaxID=75947 RepID=A0AAU9MSX2_9ASTR|nr:unnamed protein product [Lactuca virosa]
MKCIMTKSDLVTEFSTIFVEVLLCGVDMTGGMPDISLMLQNSVVSQMMQSLLSNPQYMEQIVSQNPQLRSMFDSNPQLREMMQNPKVLRQLTSPQMMQIT